MARRVSDVRCACCAHVPSHATPGRCHGRSARDVVNGSVQAHFLPDDTCDESAARGRIVEESTDAGPDRPVNASVGGRQGVGVNGPDIDARDLGAVAADEPTRAARRFLLFSSTLGTRGDQRYGSDVWVLSMPDRTPSPVVQTVFREEGGAFSPDGRWMAYASDESGALEIYVQAFPDGKTKRLVSNGGGAEPRWRADGRELFFLSADQHLMSVRTTPGASFEADKPEALFELNVPTAGLPVQGRYDVTPDGQRFLVQEVTRRTPPTELTVVLNWVTLLSRNGDR